MSAPPRHESPSGYRKETMPTGSNATHTLTNKELEDTLREVIQRLIDGQQNLLKVGEYLKDDILKLYCEEESLKRAVFARIWKRSFASRASTI